jgi:transcriptional regulator with XRE-family HTH domain
LLENKKYRDAYVSEHIRNGIPFQIRTMRDDREWTQARLGQEAGKPQNVISRLEDPNYGKVTIQTLLEIAAGFDTALLVKFVPFSRLLQEYEDVSPKALSVPSITDDISELEQWAQQDEETQEAAAGGSVIYMDTDSVSPSNMNRLLAAPQSQSRGQLEFGFKAIHEVSSLPAENIKKASVTMDEQQAASLTIAQTA